MTPRHFIDLSQAGGAEIGKMLHAAVDRKVARKGWPKGMMDPDVPLAGHTLALIFEKNSTRTRVSFDMAIRQLGGTSIVMDAGSMQLGRGETIADTARVLSRYVDAIMLRTDDHAKVEELAHYATVPVINGLSDRSHPCQIMADLLTIMQSGIELKGSQWAWLGDGNNVLNSIIEAAGLMQFNVSIGCPERYDPDQSYVTAARDLGSTIMVTRDPTLAVAGADVVVTDTWISMGQEHAEAKLHAMAPFQVNDRLMAYAKPGARFLHCLPAHREEEVTADVLEGPQSLIWDEAENRLHAQKAVLLWVLGRL